MKKIISIASLIIGLFLIGCTPPKVVPVDPAIISIQDSAKKIEASLGKLVELESSNRNGGVLMIIPKEGQMARKLTMSWNGALEPALNMITKKINYKIKYLGIAPATPLTITLDVRRTPVCEILESISWQVSPYAQMVLDPAGKTLSVAYASNDLKGSSL